MLCHSRAFRCNNRCWYRCLCYLLSIQCYKLLIINYRTSPGLKATTSFHSIYKMIVFDTNNQPSCGYLNMFSSNTTDINYKYEEEEYDEDFYFEEEHDEDFYIEANAFFGHWDPFDHPDTLYYPLQMED